MANVARHALHDDGILPYAGMLMLFCPVPGHHDVNGGGKIGDVKLADESQNRVTGFSAQRLTHCLDPVRSYSIMKISLNRYSLMTTARRGGAGSPFLRCRG